VTRRDVVAHAGRLPGRFVIVRDLRSIAGFDPPMLVFAPATCAPMCSACGDRSEVSAACR
jgi:hypothetical protein